MISPSLFSFVRSDVSWSKKGALDGKAATEVASQQPDGSIKPLKYGESVLTKPVYQVQYDSKAQYIEISPDSILIDSDKNNALSTSDTKSKKSICRKIKDYLDSSKLLKVAWKVFLIFLAILATQILIALGLAISAIGLTIALPLGMIAFIGLALCGVRDYLRDKTPKKN